MNTNKYLVGTNYIFNTIEIIGKTLLKRTALIFSIMNHLTNLHGRTHFPRHKRNEDDYTVCLFNFCFVFLASSRSRNSYKTNGLRVVCQRCKSTLRETSHCRLRIQVCIHAESDVVDEKANCYNTSENNCLSCFIHSLIYIIQDDHKKNTSRINMYGQTAAACTRLHVVWRYLMLSYYIINECVCRCIRFSKFRFAHAHCLFL